MDFSFNEEQRTWQREAREFAREEILPISLKRDQLEGGFAPWDWDIIRKVQSTPLGYPARSTIGYRQQVNGIIGSLRGDLLDFEHKPTSFRPVDGKVNKALG